MPEVCPHTYKGNKHKYLSVAASTNNSRFLFNTLKIFLLIRTEQLTEEYTYNNIYMKYTIKTCPRA
jgi:hypothetical protein